MTLKLVPVAVNTGNSCSEENPASEWVDAPTQEIPAETLSQVVYGQQGVNENRTRTRLEAARIRGIRAAAERVMGAYSPFVDEVVQEAVRAILEDDIHDEELTLKYVRRTARALKRRLRYEKMKMVEFDRWHCSADADEDEERGAVLPDELVDGEVVGVAKRPAFFNNGGLDASIDHCWPVRKTSRRERLSVGVVYDQACREAQGILTGIRYARLPEAKEHRTQMDELIQQLTPRQREVVLLILDGVTQDQIAVRLETTQPAVAKLYKRAVERLQRLAQK